MNRYALRTLLIGMGVCLVAVGGVVAAPADMGGWEADSAYNRLYDAAELDQIKARVVKVTTGVPMPGMSPATVLVVREGDAEPIDVHLGPSWFIKPGDVGVRPGDTVKVRGVWAYIDGKDVLMCNKLKKGGYYQLKMRLTSDGTPFWTMSPQQLAAERAAD